MEKSKLSGILKIFSCIHICIQNKNKSQIEFSDNGFMTLWFKVLIFLYFLTPCRSKVITPLWYFDPCRSKVTFMFGTWPLQKQGLGHSLVLTPCRSKVTIILYFSTLYKSKVTIILWFLTPCKSKVVIIL